MTNNGVVQANLRWKPVAYEVKEAYCPVWIERFGNSLDCATALQEGTFLLKKSHHDAMGRDSAVRRFCGKMAWRLADGKSSCLICRLCQNKQCKWKSRNAGSSEENTIWNSPSAANRHLVLQSREEMGKRQFELAGEVLPAQILSSGKTVFLAETGNRIKVSGESFTAVFSKETGGIITPYQGWHTLLGRRPDPLPHPSYHRVGCAARLGMV